MNRIKGIYLILDQQYTARDIISIAADAIDAGIDVLQYREKGLPKKDALCTAKRLRNLTSGTGIPFIINDDPALALAVDADGVHLGQDDIPVHVARRILGEDKIIGLSTHSYNEAMEAGSSGINYIGLGPIFNSGTKMVTEPLGPGVIRRVRNAISIPLIAIGGISNENIQDVIRCGADGAAVISAILSSSDIKKSVRNLKEKIRGLHGV
ncbi:MAG: thiamine phosphate synthase [Nitrospirae bacterium]|nr:thiamine phosphate synthase [Nitrospirota bacterium]